MSEPQHKGDIKWVFDYVNHAGVDKQYIVIPQGFQFKSLKPWYPTPTWLMRGFVLGIRDYRDFQVTKIRNLEELPL